MDNLINQVIDLEHKAQQMVREATEEQRKLQATLESEAGKIREEINAQASVKIKAVHDEKKNEAKVICENIENQKKQRIIEMQNIDRQNRDKWTEYLFKKIVGSEG